MIVIDRDISFGKGGILFTEISSVLQQSKIPIKGYITGLGGRDITVNDFENITLEVYKELEEGNTKSELKWYKLKIR